MYSGSFEVTARSVVEVRPVQATDTREWLLQLSHSGSQSMRVYGVSSARLLRLQDALNSVIRECAAQRKVCNAC